MKDKMKMKKGKPSFKEKNDIGPVGGASKKGGSYDGSIFSKEALGSEVGTSAKYAKKGKGGQVNKSVFSSKPNQISPDGNY